MNCKTVKIVSLEELLYYAMFSVLISLKGLGLDEGSTLFRLGLGCAIFLFGAKIIVGKYSVKELFVIALGGLWGIYVFFNVGSFSIFIYMLIIFGMKKISVSKVMQIGVAVYAVCFFITITLAILGERSGVLLVHEKFGLGPILRESLGYTHPNVLHVTYIVFMVFILYNVTQENAFKAIVALMLGNIFIFLYSLSYTGVMISVGLVCVYVYFLYRKKISKAERLLIKSIFPLCIFISTIIANLIEGKAYGILNKVFNNRIWAIKVYFKWYQQTFWGQKIIKENYSLDNSFIYALAWYGIVFFVIMIIAYWILIDKYLREDRRKELAIIITFLIAGMTEQFLFNASIKNITVIFLGDVFFRSIQDTSKDIKPADKYNRVFKVQLQKYLLICERMKQLNWKKIIISGMIIYVPMVLFIFSLPTSQKQHIYVNERLCDCGGETVPLEQIIQTEDTLIIGNITTENQYYYFTKENSNLVTIMDYRYKLSLSLYISVFIVIVAVSAWKWINKLKKYE